MTDAGDATVGAPTGHSGTGPRALLIPLAAVLVVALAAGGVSWAFSERDDCLRARKPALPDIGWDTVDQPGGNASGNGVTSANAPADVALAEQWCSPDVRAGQVVTTGGVLFVVGTDDELRAIDATTGASWWSVSLDDLGYYGANTGPVLTGETVVVGASSGANVGLLAFDQTKGTRLWTWESAGYSVDNLVVREGLLYASVDEVEADLVVAVDSATGTEQWRGPVTTTNDGVSLPERVFGLSVGSDAVIALVQDSESSAGRLRALDRDTGAERWSRPLDASPSAGPVIEGGRVTAFGFASGDEDIVFGWSFDVDDGEELWRSVRPPDEGSTYQGAVGPVAAIGDLVFASGDDLMVVDAATGDVLAEVYTASFGGSVIAGDRLLTCDQRIPLGASEGDPLSFELADGSGTWCPTLGVVANGVVYAIDDGDLRAFG